RTLARRGAAFASEARLARGCAANPNLRWAIRVPLRLGWAGSTKALGWHSETLTSSAREEHGQRRFMASACRLPRGSSIVRGIVRRCEGAVGDHLSLAPTLGDHLRPVGALMDSAPAHPGVDEFVSPFADDSRLAGEDLLHRAVRGHEDD